MQKVKCHFCKQFNPANGYGKIHISNNYPWNYDRINGPHGSPRDGFHNAPASFLHNFHIFIFHISILYFWNIKKHRFANFAAISGFAAYSEKKSPPAILQKGRKPLKIIRFIFSTPSA